MERMTSWMRRADELHARWVRARVRAMVRARARVRAERRRQDGDERDGRTYVEDNSCNPLQLDHSYIVAEGRSEKREMCVVLRRTSPLYGTIVSYRELWC